jgi:molybdate transport system ATP-binding protein
MSDEAAGRVLRVQIRVEDGFPLDVAFEAPPGVTVLFGPSGAGKTTTLSCIAGLLRPSSGRITLGEEAWFDSAAQIHVPPQDRRVAVVFQSLALFPHMTATENVAYGMPRTLPSGARRERAVSLLHRLRVAHLAERKSPTFSGGEGKRVALARALATSPNVVLLDEPFSSLEGELRREIASDFRESLRQLEVPVLLVTHARWEARALGEHVVALERGRVRLLGGIEELAPHGDDSSP